MTRFPRRQATALVAVLLATGALSAPASAAGSTRYVSSDGSGPQACANAAFTSIQAAITASGPEDTVLVCPGDYTELLVIKGARNGLTVRSLSPWEARLTAPPSNGQYDTVVQIMANRVTVQWLDISVPTGGDCSQFDSVIAIDGAKSALVRSNRIRATGPDTLGLCGFLDGISATNHSGGSALNNVVKDFQRYGILVEQTARLESKRNSIRFWHADVPIENTSATAPAGGFTTYGIYLRGRGDVLANRVIGLASAGDTTPQLYIGILSDSPGNGHLYDRNWVRYADYGISTYSGFVTWTNNRALDNQQTGLEVDGPTNDVGPGNESHRNRRGLAIYTSGNTIHDNDLRNNSDFDCDDDNGGNTWSNNQADTEGGVADCVP